MILGQPIPIPQARHCGFRRQFWIPNDKKISLPNSVQRDNPYRFRHGRGSGQIHWHGRHPVPLRNPDHFVEEWRKIFDKEAQLKRMGIM